MLYILVQAPYSPERIDLPTGVALTTVLTDNPPSDLSPTERLTEVAEILAAGILRLRARHSTLKGSRGETVSVDFSPDRSGHGGPSVKRRKRHGRT